MTQRASHVDILWSLVQDDISIGKQNFSIINDIVSPRQVFPCGSHWWWYILTVYPDCKWLTMARLIHWSPEATLNTIGQLRFVYGWVTNPQSSMRCDYIHKPWFNAFCVGLLCLLIASALDCLFADEFMNMTSVQVIWGKHAHNQYTT